MSAFSIANKAFDAVWHNLGAAARISIPIFVSMILVVASSWGIVSALGEITPSGQITFNVPGADLAFGAVLIGGVALVCAAIAWSAVAWHRFRLLEERPRGLIPPFHLGLVWGYLWRFAMLGLFCIIVMLPVLFLSSIVVSQVRFSSVTQVIVASAVLNGASSVFAVTFFLRSALILPAKAVGEYLGVQESWVLTKGRARQAWLMGIGYAVISLAYSHFGGGFSLGHWVADVAKDAFVQWVALMFSISILTTLYQEDGRLMSILTED